MNASDFQRLSIHVIQILKAVGRSSDDRASVVRISQADFDDTSWERIKSFVNIASDSRANLTKTPRLLWGAALMLLGVKAARGYQGGGFDWEDVIQVVGSAQARPFTSQDYDWIESGCRKFLGITLIRANHQRRVLGTMLQHAGACAAHLQEISKIIRRRWSWGLLTEAIRRGDRPVVEQMEMIAQWLINDVAPTLPAGTLRSQISAEEPRYALAAAIHELAEICSQIHEKSLLRTTPEDTFKALKQADSDAAASLSVAGVPSAYAILAEMFSSTLAATEEGNSGSGGLWRWRWIEGQGFGSVVLQAPDTLPFDRRLPPETIRVRFKIQDVAQRIDTLPLFERAGDAFKLKIADRFLIPSLPLGTSSALSIEWLDRDGAHERLSQEVAAPNDPIAIFHAQTGALLSAPSADQNLILVFASGLHITSQHIAFQRDPHSSQRLGADVWRGVMPQEDVLFTVTPRGEDGALSEDEAESLTLSPPHLSLDVAVSLRTRPRLGLRIHYHPIFDQWPQLMTEEVGGGEARIERRSSAGQWSCMHQGTFRVVAKNLILNDISTKNLTQLGLYRVTLAQGRRTARLIFGILPESFDVHVERGREASTVRAVANEENESLTLTDPSTRTDTSTLVLAPREATYTISFTATAQQEVLRGLCAVTHPPLSLRIFDGNDAGQPLSENMPILSMRLLKSPGGLVLTGAPRQKIRLTVAEQPSTSMEIDLNREGKAIWRFYALPRALMMRLSLTLSVEWLGPQYRKHELRFLSVTMIKPTVACAIDDAKEGEGLEDIAADKVGISLTVDLVNAEVERLDQVSIWMVPAWAPWTPPQELRATVTEREGKGAGIQARVHVWVNKEQLGPYMVGVLCDQRPCSGLTLALLSAAMSPHPPEHLSTLSKMLWQPPAATKARALEAVLAQSLRMVDAESVIVKPLLAAIQRFGPEYFRISKPFGEALGRIRVRALLRVAARGDLGEGEASVEDYRLLDFVRDTLEVPWATVKFDDLDAEISAIKPRHMSPCLESLHEKRAGFLVEAAQRLTRHEHFLDAMLLPSFSRQLSVLLLSAEQWPERLSLISDHEISHLQAPQMEREEGDELKPAMLSKPRFAGLLEARLNLVEGSGLIKRICKHKDDILQVLHSLSDDVKCSYIEQRGIPESVRCVESTIAAVTWEVHRWRMGGEGMSLMSWMDGDLSFLEMQRRFPILVDFWLNVWAKRDIAARFEAKTKQQAAIVKPATKAVMDGLRIRRR